MSINNQLSSDVKSALQLWQAFEYLTPQKPPDPECMKDRCTWRIHSMNGGDEEMPWVDPKKKTDLIRLFNHPKRFLLYAGLISGKELVEFVRKTLGASTIDFSEQSLPTNAASVVLPIDSDGYVAGQPFVSSIPWALGGLQNSGQSNGQFDFSGFFGQQGVQAKTIQKMQELLVKLQLITLPDDDEIQVGTRTLEERRKQFRTVTGKDVCDMVSLAFHELGWKPCEQMPWIIQTQRIPDKGGRRLEDPLNSFYAEEIENVQAQYQKSNCGVALRQFLQSEEHPDRVDLDANRSALVDGLHPMKLPPAAWPGKHPLVTAQQFAVNAIRSELTEEGGLFSVNGPPGTGKTTMLKDILADVIQSRAEVLSKLENVEDAFAGSLTIENYQYRSWRLIDSLRGFGVIATSTNNGAVENISKELPGIGSIDEHLDLDYFSEVADTLGLEKGNQRPPKSTSWGLVSAALGNSSNRSAFASAFWFADMAPTDRMPNQEPDPLRPISLQAWMKEKEKENLDWNQARAHYKEAKQRVEHLLDVAAKLVDTGAEYRAALRQQQALSQEGHAHEAQLEDLAVKQTMAAQNLRIAKESLEAHTDSHAQLVVFSELGAAFDSASALEVHHEASRPSQTVEHLSEAFEDAKALEAYDRSALAEHDRLRPGLLWLIFQRAAVRAWHDRKIELEARVDQNRIRVRASQAALRSAMLWHKNMAEISEQVFTVQQKFDVAQRALQMSGGETSLQLSNSYLITSRQMHTNASAEYQNIEETYNFELSQLSLIRQELEQLKTHSSSLEHILKKAGLLGTNRPAWHLMEQSRDEFHKASPYQDGDALFAARRQLFIASMNLHKAFLMNAWTKMRPTLSAFISVLQGQIPAHNVKGGVMALWDAFFLAVPLVSTTFASFPRLFKGVGREELAWVLIDEAGQAAPQQAVGALWRARRAIVVGDPIQLEPVVGIPGELVDPLKRFCSATDMYVPPFASVQTLSDRSNRYGTFLGGSDPNTRIWVGSPLVVHRRCLNPMFDISNAIAYENKMVYGTFGGQDFDSATSEWIDVSNSGASGHWIPTQGDMAMKLIMETTKWKVRDGDGKLRIYVITPFKIVAENMRNLLCQKLNPRDANEMCGTVHTFQGKEADHVIFLLGGDPNKPGVISSFAGRKPNLVNVAVTRAKKRLYVIGQRSYWCGYADVNRLYTVMDQKLSDQPRCNSPEIEKHHERA